MSKRVPSPRRVPVNPKALRRSDRAPEKTRELLLAEMAMTPLLKQLASLAIRFGITPKEVGDIVKVECVNEAAQVATLRNGRVNHSRVAVITGLSRNEIRRLLGTSGTRAPAASRHRAWRLISAWLTDPRFLDSGLAPRVLPIRSARSSFSDLARQYCGDVPEKAVLVELQRIGAIELANGKVRLKRGIARNLRREVGRAKWILQATSNVLQQFKASHLRRPLVKSAVIAVNSPADHAVILQRIESTLAAAFDAMKSLGERQMARGIRRRTSISSQIEVSAIVTAGTRRLGPGR